MKNKNMIKSVGAVVGGFLAVVVLSIATDTVLEATHIFPPIRTGLFITWMLVLALVYRSVYTIIGGYVTARLAPNKPMKHVMSLAILGVVAGSLGAVAAKDMSPLWYPVALVVEAVPLTWFGGKLMKK